MEKKQEGETGFFEQVTILFNRIPPSLSCKLYLCCVSIYTLILSFNARFCNFYFSFINFIFVNICVED